MFDSLTIHHLRVSAFGVVDLDGTGTINLLDNVRAFPFREKLSYKKILNESFIAKHDHLH